MSPIQKRIVKHRPRILALETDIRASATGEAEVSGAFVVSLSSDGVATSGGEGDPWGLLAHPGRVTKDTAASAKAQASSGRLTSH